MADFTITGLSTLTNPATNDVFVMVDVSDTSTPPAGAGGSDKKITLSAIGTALSTLIPYPLGTASALATTTTPVIVSTATAPSLGQLLTAQSGTNATWANPAGTVSYALTSGTAFASTTALTAGTAFSATSSLTAGTASYALTSGTAFTSFTTGTANALATTTTRVIVSTSPAPGPGQLLVAQSGTNATWSNTIGTAVTINGNDVNNGILNANNNANDTFLPVFNALAPNLSNGNSAIFFVGRSLSTNDSGQVLMRVGGSPVINFGLFGVVNGLNVDGNGGTWTGTPDVKRNSLDDGTGNALIQNNLSVTTAGNGYRTKEGSNAKQGLGTLTAGTVTLANTSITASSRIFLTAQSPGGTPGALFVNARTAGTSFTVKSTSVTDTSVFAFEIYEPA